MHNVIMFIKLVLNENKNYYYYKIFLEKSLYKFAKKVMTTKFFDSIIMLIFEKIQVAKEFYGTKKLIEVQHVDVDNIIISKSVETKDNSKYLTGYLDDVIR